MSRKPKPIKSVAKSIPFQARDDATLVLEANAALLSAHHKEATEIYKLLIKRERRPEWVDALASCYAGRAHDLATTGMFKEAIVLWRNRHQLCGKPLIVDAYLGWLASEG